MSRAHNMRGAAATVARGRAFRSALMAGAAAVAVAVAGCGTVPGAAVTVDGTQVSTEAVLARVTSVLDASAGTSGSSAPTDDYTRTQAARTQITDIIRHQLAERAAAESGITVSAKEVNDFIAQYDAYQKGSGSPDLGSVLQVPSGSVEDAVYDLQVLDALIKKIPESGVEVTNVSVTVDAVPAADWATAVADRVKFTADPAAMDAAAAAARAANPQLPGGAESLLEQPHHAAFGLFSAAQGEILLIPQGAQGYLVTRITKRVQAPATLTAQMITNANQTAGLSGEIALASLLFAKDAESAHVQVNPRFGIWDPHIVQVVAASDAA